MNTKRQRFVDAYLTEAAGNATKAAEIAGYSPKTAGQQGYMLLKDPEIKAAVAERAQALAVQADITAERILSETADVAYAKVDLKGSDKIKALELLGRYRKLWEDKRGDKTPQGFTVNIGFMSTTDPAPTVISIAPNPDAEIDRSLPLVPIVRD